MTLIVAALAVYRITRLIVDDSIFDRPRDALARQADWLDSLLSCVWCAGFWVSVLVTLALYATDAASLPVVGWLLLPFAFSAIAGLLNSWV